MRSARLAHIQIQYATSRRGVPHARRLRAWALRALLSQRGELCIRVVGAGEGRDLNRRWRRKDRPTNVLSFPAAPTNHESRVTNHVLLGDLVICAPVVAREARDQGKTLSAHWAHMVVHGVLHLLGHDHVKNRDAKKMAAREVEILSHFGYQDPYLSH